jgi:Zn-dependent protease with chaperone function
VGRAPTAVPTPAAARPAPARPPQPEPAVLSSQILDGFQGTIEPVRTSLGYRLGILLVSLVMVILPLLYLGLIGLVAWLLYYHATHGTWLVETGRGALVLIAYIGPLVAGVILLFFMVKPLLARPAGAGRPRSLSRENEPLLFTFVDRVCQAVGAPAPVRIDVDCQVNASAGFRRGIWSMVGRDLVLTIGMPLVAGMSLRQFAGVLAHEFGHFTQGAGMRLTYVIRSISWWFTRVVYERDAWDQRLIDWSNAWDARLAGFFWLARLFIWLTRKVLWVLMMVGHAVGGFMLRQMEFDADLHEARLAGSDVFETTCRRLAVLNVASQGAFADLEEWYKEGRLGDNLPKLIMANVAQIPPKLLQELNQHLDQAATGPLDTHPADKDRIAAAKADNAPGIFQVDLPAACLFSNFDALSKTCTWDYYKEIFGESFSASEMHPVDDLLARQGKEIEARKSLGRFFQGLYTTMRPLPLPTGWIGAPSQPKECVARIKQARQRLLAVKDACQVALNKFDIADTQLMEVDQASACLRGGLTVRPGDFGVPLTNTGQVEQLRREAVDAQRGVEGQMSAFEQAASARLVAALELLHVPQLAQKLPEAPSLAAEVERLFPALALLNRQLPSLLKLRNEFLTLQLLCVQLEGNSENAKLIEAIREKLGAVRSLIESVYEVARATDYPFDHAKGDLTIAQYCVDGVPAEDDLEGVFDAANRMGDRLFTLLMRVVSRLSAIAEQVETALGFEPLPDPPEPAETNAASNLVVSVAPA